MSGSTKYSENHPHLLETSRLQLARDYLVHEFRKIFHDITKDMAYRALSECTPNKDSGDKTIRDFWNLFCAMSSTWRLKDLYEIVTDANMDWKERAIPIGKLCPETPQGWMDKWTKQQVPSGRYDFNDAVAFLRKDASTLANAMNALGEYPRTHGIGSLDDHIIVVKEADFYKVVDGNGRLSLIIARCMDEGSNISSRNMNAWLGESRGKRNNCWIPTSSLCFLRQICDEYAEQTLKRISPLAWTEYQKRVTFNIPED